MPSKTGVHIKDDLYPHLSIQARRALERVEGGAHHTFYPDVTVAFREYRIGQISRMQSEPVCLSTCPGRSTVRTIEDRRVGRPVWPVRRH
ncbi:hypothetical protein GCM10007887_23990 [Methylobacterium haplocladii]|uniref:Uncharacterized protein n=1 Tax=Methylobacterium haplocladii TaxID=1176176 RepID=A0A512IVJ6_9HYPH|nr:hypothetical protein MHA02_41240 [Methylobacterium haplocladii]GLS59728.1 hypothetical protein GCM10007887_23990 [Methylobacterium haplocladii]